MTAETPERLRFVRFRGSAGGRLIPLAAVVEVIPMVRLRSSEQGGNPRYCGLLHFRGRVVPVFDLVDGRRSGLHNPDHFLVVTRGQAGERAIVAHEVEDIVEVEARACSELDVGGSYPVSVVDLNGALLEVVDPDRLTQ